MAGGETEHVETYMNFHPWFDQAPIPPKNMQKNDCSSYSVHVDLRAAQARV